VNVSANTVQIEDRVANDLTGTVVGDIAAAVGLAELDSLLAQNMFRDKQILPAGVAAQGEYMRMLAENEDIVDHTRFARNDETLLEGVGGVPREKSEVSDEQRSHG
jgi:hypothetical protein